MKFNFPLFLTSLKIMGLGMLGIFTVTLLLIVLITLLKKFGK